MKHFWILALGAVLLLALAGCTQTGPVIVTAPAPGETSSPGITSPGTAAPAATLPAPPAPADTATTGAAATPAAAPATQPAAGGQAGPLKQLNSFVAQVTYNQDVIKPAPTAQSSVSMELRYSTQPTPGAYYLDIKDNGAQGQAAGEMKMVVVGSDSYIYTAEQGKWIKIAVSDSDTLPSDLFDPNQLATIAPAALFTQANLVNGHEKVGDVDTSHYKATGAALNQMLSQENNGSQVLSATADFWVANSGGYLKQYQLDTTLQDSDGQQTHVTGKMTVTSVNQPVDIATPAASEVMETELLNATAEPAPAGSAATEPPATAAPAAGAGAAAELKKLPLPPQSQAASADKLSAAAQAVLKPYIDAGLPLTIYSSSSKQADLIAFYNTQASKAGWSPLLSQATGDGPYMLMYQKGQLQLLVLLVPDGAKQVVFLQIAG